MFSRLARKLLPPPTHPIDRQLGIHTSGTVSTRRLRTGDAAIDQANRGYAGSQPSVIAAALRALGEATAGVEFIDLGCGKGRVLAAAGAFPFARVTGIEIAPGLARIAEHNLDRLRAAGAVPAGSRIVEGDATRPALSPGAVLFLYNPFGADLVGQLVDHLERHLAKAAGGKLWVVCYNPVHAAVFDASPALRRYYAERLPYSAEERRALTFDNAFDSVVIWQSVGPDMRPPCPGADRAVKVTIPDLGADVVGD